MKFDFCGKLDCPDWILAQLYHASSLDSARFQSVCQLVKEAILEEGNVDEMRLFDELQVDEVEFDIDDVRCCFAALNYILTGACHHQVATKQLTAELEQLGLPSDHCEIISGIYEENSAVLREHLD